MKRQILSLIAVFAAAAFAQTAPTGQAVLEMLEKQNKLGNDLRARVNLTQTKAGQGAKQMAMQYFRRDKDDAFAMLIDAPEADRGNGYLRQGEHFWMYRRNTRTFQHVNRDESIGGTNAHGQDFENRKLTTLYAPAKGELGTPAPEMLGKKAVWKFEVRAKLPDVDYPRKIYWVSRDEWFLLKEQAYSASGTLMQSSYYTKYIPVDGRTIPSQMLFVDEFEKGNRTVVELSEVKTGKIPDETFTKAWIESKSK
ncbi:MAG: hypothetical protein RL318_2080 [Fibrobacterota bacterium]|jgi:outer membrane lipoprotein-sorting protein